jgi:diketogulonate reductase-like aldo/keto reductase
LSVAATLTAHHADEIRDPLPAHPARGATLSTHASSQPTTTLADGHRMPLLGLGVWQIPDGPECVNAVRWALELGYRHIDTAQAYGNEASVGRALEESGVARDDVFITTKFMPRSADPVAEAEQSLRRLGLDHVDLYLVHWPQGGPGRAWPGMERVLELGYARSIGVSNFSEADLDAVARIAGSRPTVNQVNFNPAAPGHALLEACRRHDVVLEAYSPLGTGRLVSDATVGAVAARLGRTPAQVLMRWCVQRGIPAVVKSTHRDRIEANGQIFDFELTDEDFSQLDALDRPAG